MNPEKFSATRSLSGSQGNSSVHSILAVVFIAVLLMDSLLSDLSTFVNQSFSESARVTLFSAIAILAVIFGGRLVLSDTRKIRSEFSSNNILNFASRIMPFIQYSILALLIVITLQMIFTSQYYTYIMITLTGMSWAASIGFMLLMSYKLIQWYRVRRNLLVLLYFVSSALIASVLALGIVPQIVIMTQTSSFSVSSHSSETKPFQANPVDLTGLYVILSVVNWLVIPLSFIIWAATAVMLRHYANSFGPRKYWLMISLPLVSIIIGVTFFLIFQSSVTTVFDPNVIVYTMIAFGGILSEGFLLGFAFIKISKHHRGITQSRLSGYLLLSAKGVTILFVAFFANPSGGSYLPFGIISVSFLCYGTYLFFSGIYSCAITIAGDIRLRQTIRKSLLDESKLLDNIGLADLNHEVERVTTEIVKKHNQTVWQETGIDASIPENDMKDYVNEVAGEIEKIRQRRAR
ncbi:hypothetical protein NTE_00465 [Candidatus Nitrososphaera evergladensis SR1]|uniref:Uncharacterized protein n=1 Tax=Candidatus Nitrososphaera evergladensis SR1 TaxID=1459636 RepID=A0A075MP18_9ARCH|nr:hypothetical protein [Candidatus Nitrososphaera evergladensis]AIF82547.1 hypothetical protein NTE_00465 [Candidatus Nitrososphaera evergladensis SR1]